MIDWLLLPAALLYFLFIIRILRGLRIQTDAPVNPDTPDVAVLIAARNERDTLPELLSDLQNQDYPEDRLKIYVVDDRSEDGTGEWLDEQSGTDSRLRILHIRETNPEFLHPKKWALKKLLELVEEDILLATDADCRVGPRWVSSGIRRLQANTGVVVGYSQVGGDSLFARYQNFDFMALMGSTAGLLNLGTAWSGSGQNLLYRRSAFEATGGYQTTREAWSGDDVFIVQSISNLPDYEVVFHFDPGHYVTTRASPSLLRFLMQRIRWSSYSAPSRVKKPMFMLFLVSAFLTNLALLLGFLTARTGLLFGGVLVGKFVLEGAVQAVGAWRFQQKGIMAIYPLWFLIQPVYIPLMGILGLFKMFQWKT